MPSKIEWLQGGETWNVISGCSPISYGCQNCWANRMAKRLAGRFGYPTDEPFRVTFHEDKLDQPYRWRKPRNVFVVSMGDMFHEKVEYDWLEQIFAVMKAVKQHRYFILTKRPKRMRELFPRLTEKNTGLNHIFCGISVENQRAADERLPDLIEPSYPNKFVSVEPILGPIDLSISIDSWRRPELWIGYLDWVIVGDESGPHRRPANLDWVRSIRDQCIKAEVPFFFKQWHRLADGDKISMPKLDGKRWIQMPKETS